MTAATIKNKFGFDKTGSTLNAYNARTTTANKTTINPKFLISSFMMYFLY